eukprot:gnl/MRDRNA2_/MRDRNA2_16881_c0_seq1.p1 gnl/MRDRNA2_/MRDRNA2_16881_c0~~gnl/MRDRNA2_/MRDRNA2_16881_c0_seq1.p1  ORF type:complete len:409 (-),score=43.82 gnl/MRDRNA2_/MRDRNA2_16881_c0_seq1:98-1246(-)
MEGQLTKVLLKGAGLVKTAEMLPPRDVMQLSQWNRASRGAVLAAEPSLELSKGSLHGRKICMTWAERLIEMDMQMQQISRMMSMGGEITAGECIQLCSRVRHALQLEPNVVAVRAPVVVVGDVCGQFYDLLQIFNELTGTAPLTSYLFLGNYVKCGYDSCSTLCLLFLLKARYPKHITLLRGNFESRQLGQVYGFYDECMNRFHPRGPEIWKCFVDCFDYLPVSATIENQIFCVHGGLSPSLDSLSLDHIKELDRMQEVPHEGPICDLLWADPDDRSGWGIVPKGAGYTFGANITKEFLQLNGLSFIARSHQLVMEGFHWRHDKQVVTIFSAPNYRGRCGNEGAVLVLDEHLESEFLRFGPAPVKSMSKVSCRSISFESSID